MIHHSKNLLRSVSIDDVLNSVTAGAVGIFRSGVAQETLLLVFQVGYDTIFFLAEQRKLAGLRIERNVISTFLSRPHVEVAESRPSRPISKFPVAG